MHLLSGYAPHEHYSESLSNAERVYAEELGTATAWQDRHDTWTRYSLARLEAEAQLLGEESQYVDREQRLHDKAETLLAHGLRTKWDRDVRPMIKRSLPSVIERFYSQICRHVLKELSGERFTLLLWPQSVSDQATPRPAPRHSDKKWKDIEISFLSDERVQIHASADTETRNYNEMGFADGRTGKPNKAWETLRLLAKSNGMIPIGLDGPKMVKQRQGPHGAEQTSEVQGRTWRNMEKRMQEIRGVLQKHFGISDDPIPCIKGTGYRAQFKIGCARSYES